MKSVQSLELYKRTLKYKWSIDLINLISNSLAYTRKHYRRPHYKLVIIFLNHRIFVKYEVVAKETLIILYILWLILK